MILGPKMMEFLSIPIYKCSGMYLSCPYSNLEILKNICTVVKRDYDADLF